MAVLWQQLCSLWKGPTWFIILFLSSPGTNASSLEAKKCEVVRGNFSRTFLRVGYHKIAEIPKGAFNISIQETQKSRNYLALLTKSGISIINGNWVIDRPGNFTALGTRFVYRRPNEIRSRNGESITARGPLTDDIHFYLIYQQPGPNVHFEYSTLLKPNPTSHMDTRPELLSLDESLNEDENDIINEGANQKEETFHLISPPKAQLSYIWIKSGQTQCSTTCGTGKHRVFWSCVDSESQVTVPADLCDPASEPTNQEEDCNKQPCPASWDVGEWSDCDRKCGPGTQHRHVICRQVTHVHLNETETSVTVSPKLCSSSDRPVTKATCQLKICSQWEIRSEWTTCSVPCGVGQRSRDVVCVSNLGDVDDEECNTNLKPESLQNCDMGVCARSWFTSPWSQRCSAVCGKGSKTRSVVCLMDHVTDLLLDSCEGDRPNEVMPCDSGPCQNQLEWYASPWSQCSAECGDGTQTRSLVCIFTSNAGKEIVDQSRCSGLSKPITAQQCRLKLCGVQWYVTEWSACSRSCDGGYRVREVRCLADDIVPSDLCDLNLIPDSEEKCNQTPCPAEGDVSCSDQYHKCVVVVQARLCIYPYYRGVCCASCLRVQETYPSSFQRNLIHR